MQHVGATLEAGEWERGEAIFAEPKSDGFLNYPRRLSAKSGRVDATKLLHDQSTKDSHDIAGNCSERNNSVLSALLRKDAPWGIPTPRVSL